MESRERVLRTIERSGPDRLPIHYVGKRYLECSDVLAASYGPAAEFAPSEPGMTEWGYVWQSLNETMGQPRESSVNC